MSSWKKYNLISLIAAAGVFALVAVARGGEPSAGVALGQLRGDAGTEAAAPGAAVPVPYSLPGEGVPAKDKGPAGGYNALVWNPENKGDWYEWWYYKVVVPGTDEAFYFCYGVVNPGDKEQSNPASRSYVSAGSFAGNETFEQTFGTKEFSASSQATLVKVGGNVATDRALKGSLTAPDGGTLSWDLTLEKDWGANLMAWTMYLDWICNIYWYPAQAGARMSGTVNYRGKTVTLNKAPAYQDRNWGTSFPKWWTWLVSNSFKNSPGTILASGGGQPRIYPGVSPIQTVTIGLRHEGREYLFRPTTGDIVTVDVNFGKWEVSARNKWGERMTISAYAPREKFMLLEFMTPQGQVFNDYEALTGRINVKLYNGSKLIADLETDSGGIEFGSPASFTGAVGSGELGFEELFSQENHLQ